MDRFWLILFLFLYYVRPHEWIAAFAKFRLVQIDMICAVIAIATRARGFRARDLFRTPHDWWMLAWFVWTWSTAPSGDKWEVFKMTHSLVVMYFVTQQTLFSLPRIAELLKWWTILIIFIASLALLSEIGIDPLGSHDVTMNRMKGRLTLNLSVFRNPNALGHNVLPAIGMIYFVFIWKRALSRPLGLALIAIPALCIWKTVSKGAFLSASVVLVGVLAFGRPKAVQIIIAVFAISAGGGLVYALPRMQELRKSKTDEAIQGRVEAFKHGLTYVSNSWRGAGYGRFIRSFRDSHGYRKASHSSFNEIGCELGWGGYFITWAIIYCCLRTLVTAQTRSVEEERVRRILFVLISSYVVSSWMVDMAYRPTWFVFTAAIAAYHRHLLGINDKIDSERIKEEQLDKWVPPWRRALRPAGVTTLAQVTDSPVVEGPMAQPFPVAVMEADKPVAEETQPAVMGGWNRFGIIDFAITWILVKATIKFWGMLIQRM
jgi:hypothetical protein